GQHPASHSGDGARRREGPRRENHAGIVSMIAGLDHAVVVVRDIEAGVAAYRSLFARAPAWRAEADGVATALFTLDNTTLELIVPKADTESGKRIRAVLDAQGEGLASICFRTGDIMHLHRRLERLALKPTPVGEAQSR